MSESADVLIRRWFQAALAAVDPTAAVERSLTRESSGFSVHGEWVPVKRRLIVLAIGKAAAQMAAGANVALGDLVTGGLALTKDGHAAGVETGRVEVLEASHPILDERGISATRRMLASVHGLGPDDVVLAMISGGGSALLELPKPGLQLADTACVTDLLLRAGAPIQHLNAVRVPLSEVKGGGLRRAASPARMVTLLLSDVIGNDARVIASGPTVPSEASADNALNLLKLYGLLERVPSVVLDVLRGAEASPGREHFSEDIVEVIADNDLAIDAFAAAARVDGYVPSVIWRQKTGEARQLACDWIRAVAPTSRGGDVVSIGGGEATVTVTGDGSGGRNTEFALAAALELERRDIHGWTIASLATDGQDATTGVAGAIASVETVIDLRNRGISPEDLLDRNDTLRAFDAVGGMVDTGPTGTNVNDLYVAVRR